MMWFLAAYVLAMQVVGMLIGLTEERWPPFGAIVFVDLPVAVLCLKGLGWI